MNPVFKVHIPFISRWWERGEGVCGFRDSGEDPQKTGVGWKVRGRHLRLTNGAQGTRHRHGQASHELSLNEKGTGGGIRLQGGKGKYMGNANSLRLTLLFKGRSRCGWQTSDEPRPGHELRVRPQVGGTAVWKGGRGEAPRSIDPQLSSASQLTTS